MKGAGMGGGYFEPPSSFLLLDFQITPSPSHLLSKVCVPFFYLIIEWKRGASLFLVRKIVCDTQRLLVDKRGWC